jgi:hypothetical protein
VTEFNEFVLSPGIFRPIKGADKIIADIRLLEDPSAEQLQKLQGEFRQWFVASK